MILVALLKTKGKLRLKINNLKSKFKKKFKYIEYINDIPHLTICKTKIYEKNIKKIIKDEIYFDKFFIVSNKFNVFKNDPITKGNSFYLNIKKNKNLVNLQRNVVKVLSKFRTIEKMDFKNKILNNNFKNFGFPFVGKIWKPHISIGSVLDNKIDKTYLQNFQKQNFYSKTEINKIYFYSLNKNQKLTFKFYINAKVKKSK